MTNPPSTDSIFPDGFSRYSTIRVQQDDIAVRRKLASELAKVRNHLQNVHEDAVRASATSVADASRRVFAEVEQLESEIRLAEGGAKLPFFSAQRRATPDIIEKVVAFDYSTLTALEGARTAASNLEANAAAADAPSTVASLVKIRNHLTNARNALKDRRDIIRGIH